MIEIAQVPFNKTKFLSFYINEPNYASASDCFDAISTELSNCGILTDLTLIGALGTIRTEVGRPFSPIAEITDGSTYENRHDLGNYCPGDGKKYKGRGFIQLTGRNNYENYGKVLNVDLPCHPELALQTDIAAKILAQYFKDHNINLYCEQKNWIKVRQLINGGSNGLAVFLSVVNQYLN